MKTKEEKMKEFVAVAKSLHLKGIYVGGNRLETLEKSKKNGYHTDIEKDTIANKNFRKVLFTGPHAQLVLMSLLPGEDIGAEVHPDLDQFIRIEKGTGKAIIGGATYSLKDGDCVIVPAGTRHNIIASPNTSLKLYTVYTTKQHPDGVIEKTKADQKEEE